MYRLREVGTDGMGRKFYIFEVPGQPVTKFIAYASWFWRGRDPWRS